MNDIQQYRLAYGGMINMSDKSFTLEHEAEDIVWCKYSDVEPLEEWKRSSKEGFCPACEGVGEGEGPEGATQCRQCHGTGNLYKRIAELSEDKSVLVKTYNQLFDEAKKYQERIAELVTENENLKQFDFTDNDLWNDSVRSRWEMILTQATARIERYSERITKLEAENKLAMGKGCVLAAAEACRVFDQPVIAEHILESAGITDDELQQCADYDLEALRKASLTEVESNL